MTTKIETKLGTLQYNLDKDPHIIVNIESCEDCKLKPCILGCPAQCFQFIEGQIHFQYEDCIECGTCKILCKKEAIQWNYPRGSFGVVFRKG